jgi:hypothetical protein
MKKPLRKPAILSANQRHMVTIHDVEFPLTTLDSDELKAGCLVPAFEPAVVPMGKESVVLKAVSGKPAQVLVGYAQGLTGAECLIIRETANALDEVRQELDVLRKGLRAALQISEELASYAKIGQDGMRATHLQTLEEGIRQLREAFFPDDPPAKATES